MVESGLTRREALKRAGTIAVGGTLLAGTLGAVLATESEAAPGCGESVRDIVSIAAVAEALAVTFYYQGIIKQPVGGRERRYLMAALGQEKNHLDLLRGAGAAQPPNRFFFDPRTFESKTAFTNVLDALETAFIGAYAAGIDQFAELGRGDLAKLSARILGVESEHRVLGRDFAGVSPPNNLLLEKAPFTCVSEAATALAPFLSDGPNRNAFNMPTDAQIRSNTISSQ